MKLEAFVREHSRSNEETVRRYLRTIHKFTGWLGSRHLDVETLQEYEAWLKQRYGPNSLASNITSAINLYLRWKGTDLKLRRPSKQVAANPKLVSDKEYEAILARIPDLEERLVVRILHDSLLRPSDVVSIRLADLDTSEGVTIIRKRTQKTGAISESILAKETVDHLTAYIAARGITDYVFVGESKPFRHRTWPNAVLRKHGAEGVTPRTFRRTGATRWGEDMRSLMAQGGWNDLRTVMVYRRNLRERHLREFESAMGPARDREPEEDPPGYR